MVAKREYRRVGKLLLTAGVMTIADGPALAMLATSWATWVEAETAAIEHGLIVKGRDGAPAVNPYRKIANEAYDRTRQLLVEFGMTPSSRTRVKAVAAPLAVATGNWWEASG
jgi:P27 family predicted phage terminase small subunit